MKTLLILSALLSMFPGTASLARGDRPANQIAKVVQESGHALLGCNGCPPFVAVPEPPTGMRRISHAAVYELTWAQYLPAVEDGSCKFPLRTVDGRELTPEERRKFDLNWTAMRLRLSDIACFKAWLQRRLPSGYIIDIPRADEWVWLAKAGEDKLEFSAETAVLIESKGYSLPPYLSVPDTQPDGLYCGPVATMKPNSWGLYDMVGHFDEVTSAIKPIDGGKLAHLRIVELRGGGCLTPTSKVPIDKPDLGLVDNDNDTLHASHAVRLIVVEENAHKVLDAE